MASNTTPQPRRSVLAVAVTALLVASAAAVGVSLTAVGTASAAPTGIDECTTIDESGVYELTSDIAVTYEDESDTCVRITASDVTLDGNGHTIGAQYGVNIGIGSDGMVTNVTVRDVTLSNPAATVAVDATGVSDSTLANVSVTIGLAIEAPLVELSGDNNTVAGLTGPTTLEVVGDDNRVLDSRINEREGVGINVTGDRNLVRNVTPPERYAPLSIRLTGADNAVYDSSFRGSYSLTVVSLDDTTGTVFVDNALSKHPVSIENTTGAVIRNNTVKPNPSGTVYGSGTIDLENSDDNELVNNDFTAAYSRIEFTNSDDNTVRGNVVNGSISVDDESGSNLIYDNRVTGVSVESGAEQNTWNVTPQAGENVIGGDTIAGNYYANADGTGFSQTCTDADGDGICDSPNEFNGSNTDYAPLAGLPPVGDGQSPTDPDADGLYEDVDGDGAFAYDDVIVFFEHFRDAAVQDYEAAFDFDGSGGVTYSDVVALFETI